MKTSLFLIGLILASVLLTDAHHKHDDRVIPKKMCKKGLFDDKACQCKCNPIGDVSPVVFCWLNGLMCRTRGLQLPEDCCTDVDTNVVSASSSSSSEEWE